MVINTMSTFKLGAIKLNETFTAGTLFDCRTMKRDRGFYGLTFSHGTLWKQTLLGCKFLAMIQEIFGFKVKYVIAEENYNMMSEIQTYLNTSEHVDLFLRPMTFRPFMATVAYPLASVFNWEFGFILRRPNDTSLFRTFYTQPFSRYVWCIIDTMAILFAVLFYFLGRWEKKVLKEKQVKPSFFYEMLFVIGGHCQHIPPMEAALVSRRTAYIVFLLFAYVVYTYYCSNLLSHIVNDTENTFTLERLLNQNSDIECVILSDIKMILINSVPSKENGNLQKNVTELMNRLLKLRAVSAEEGLMAVKYSNTALMSDWINIAPMINKVFQNDELCDLIKITVIGNMKKFFFVSNKFPHKELFRIAAMRIKEAGLGARLMNNLNESFSFANIKCTPPAKYHTEIYQIMSPLAVLFGTTVLSVFILFGEIIHFRRNRVWPYVE